MNRLGCNEWSRMTQQSKTSYGRKDRFTSYKKSETLVRWEGVRVREGIRRDKFKRLEGGNVLEVSKI